MPFFRTPLKKEDRINKNVTLQVRIPLKLYGVFGKRVLSAAFVRKKGRISRISASLTVEAALALPLFLFAMAILMMPIKIINEGRKIQMALESVCQEVSQYAYLLSDNVEMEKAAGHEHDSISEELLRNFTGAGVLVYADHEVRRHVDAEKYGRFSFLQSSFLTDGETVDLVLNYEINLPFPVFRLKSVPMTARSCRRVWIGRKGGLTGEDSSQNKEDELVYVGKGSTRYHRLKTCHYLYNDITAVAGSSIENLRNAEGKKYRPCARCKAAGGSGDMVYIMPSGESYHSSRSCSAIVAYVRAVPLSEVEHLGACSYCGN